MAIPNEIEPPYLLIREDLENGNVVPFIGAGASLAKSGEASAKLLSASELSRQLADVTSFPSEDPRERSDLVKVASYFVYINGRSSLRRRLRERLAVNAAPGALQEYLAGLPGHRLIITTNYDTLLEQALRAANKSFHLVVHPDPEKTELRGSVLWWPPGEEKPQTPATNVLDIDLKDSTVIYKMHGTLSWSASSDWDNFVITEDDYTDFLSQMSGGNSAIPAIFQAHFHERNFLFLGYSLSDWNLRVILNNLSRPLREEGRRADFAAWAIQRNPSLFERKLWGKRNVEIFDQDIDEFVARLREAGG
jgi:hypothetical protein